MAFQWADGFDYFNTSADLLVDGSYGLGTSYTFNKTSGYGGGGCITSNNSTASRFMYKGASTLATIVVGMRWKLSSLAAGGPIWAFNGALGTSMCGLNYDSSNHFFFWRGTSATVIATGSTTTISAGVWYYLEMKIVFSTTTTGSYELRITQDNVAQVSEFSGTSTQTSGTANAACTAFVFGYNASAAAGSVYCDDFYMLDTTSSAPYNDFLGDCRIETLLPTSDDSVTFTPLSSTNASNVDDASMDSGTTYNYSYAHGDIDTFNIAALSETPAKIYAGIPIMAVIRDDVTTQTARTKIGTHNGATNSVPLSAYYYFRDVYLTDPATGQAWTKAGVDGSKVGYEHI